MQVYIDEKTEVRCADTTFAERGSPLNIRAEPSPDDATGLPWTERTLRRWKITPCDGWVVLWLLEVLVLSRMAVCLSPPTSLTFD